MGKERDKNRRSSPCVREQWPLENDWRPNISILKKDGASGCHFPRSNVREWMPFNPFDMKTGNVATLEIEQKQFGGRLSMKLKLDALSPKQNVKCGHKLTTFIVSIFL
jgi:hypothetical protein